jgi:hypothetical protein
MDQQNTNQSKPVKPITELLTKEVNRTEFLSIVGVGALGVVGLGPILHFLTGKGGSSSTVIHKHQAESGFGAGPYGV